MGEQLKIGENLKNIRKSMGLSLDAVSSMTGVSKTMLSQIERSESVPTLATVSKIANGLKIRFDNLLTSPQSLYCDIKYILLCSQAWMQSCVADSQERADRVRDGR